MNKKKWFSVLGGMLCLIALFIIYFFMVQHNEKVEEAENAAASTKVLNVDSSDIVAISFMLDSTKQEFTKTEDTWTISSDDAFDVDEDKLNNLVSTITTMTSDRVLTDVENLSEYGLDVPVETAVLTDKNGKTYTIYWGSSNSSTNNDYVYVNEEVSTIYTVDYSVLEALGGTLEDFKATTQENTEETTAEETITSEDN